MQLQGVGREEHNAQAHRVTKCMHDLPHAGTEGGMAKTAASPARTGEVQGGGEQLSLSAWLDKHLSGGKKLLRGIWDGNGTSAVGEDGNGAVQARTGNGSGTVGGNMHDADAQGYPVNPSQTSRRASALSPAAVSPEEVSRAAAAVSLREASTVAAAQTAGGQEESLWQKAKVRFKDIAGQLTGHLRGNAFSPRKKGSFQTEQERRREEPRKAARSRKDAVDIAGYHIEESYLLDSYDRKGGYSRLSAKK